MFIVLGIKDGCCIDSTRNSSVPINNISKENNNNRYWPVDHFNRYKMKNHHQQTRNTVPYKIRRHQQQFYCKQCSGRNHVAKSGASYEIFQD